MSDTTTITKSKASATGELVTLTPSKIKHAVANVRADVGDVTDLAESIATHGLISPLRVDGDNNLIAGHRRLAAIEKLIEQKRWTGGIPCFVVATDEPQSIVAMLIENLQRVDLNPVEEALGFQRLAVEHGMKAGDIARHVNRSVTHVRERISLCALPAPVLESLRSGDMKIQTALHLLKLDSTRLERLLKKGPNPTEYQVLDAIQRAKKADAEAPIKKLLKEAGFKIDSYVSGKANLHSARCTLDTLPGQLDKIPASRGGKIATLNNYDSPITVSLYWDMTEKEIAKRQAEADKAKEKRDQEHAEFVAQQNDHFAAQLAITPADVQEWYALCERMTSEYEMKSDAAAEQVSEATVTFLRDLPTKDVAAMALRYVAANFLSNFAWRLRDEDTAAFIKKVLDIAEKDLVLLETREVDWKATVLGNAKYITRAAALSLHSNNSTQLTSAINDHLNGFGLLIQPPTLPHPPAIANVEPFEESDDVTFEDVIGFVESVAYAITHPIPYEEDPDNAADDAA